MAIEGAREAPVTLRVRPQDRAGMGLVYRHEGAGVGRIPLAEAPDAVRLIPCRNRPRTSFVGAILSETLPRSVTLEGELAPSRVAMLRIPMSP